LEERTKTNSESIEVSDVLRYFVIMLAKDAIIPDLCVECIGGAGIF